MKIKSIFIIIITVLITSSSFAQQKGKYMASLYYNTSIAVGRSSDFIDNVSFAGVSFDGKQFISNKTAVGLLFGWNVFSKEDDGLKTFTNGAIYGHTASYVNAIPFLASITYFPNTSRSAKTKFYMTGYVGAYDILTLSTRYNYAFSPGTAVNGDDSNEQSWINISLGIGYNSW